MNIISKLLRECIEKDKEILLRPDDIIRAMVRDIPAENTEDFMVFQRILRGTKVGEIFYSTNDSLEKDSTRIKALQHLISQGVEKEQAEFVLGIMIGALEWDTSKVDSSAPSLDLPEEPPLPPMPKTEPPKEKVMPSTSPTMPLKTMTLDNKPEVSGNKTKWMVAGGIFLVVIVLAGIYMYKGTVEEKNTDTPIISSDEMESKPPDNETKKQEQISIENDPHWIMDKESGVYLWNPKPQEGESIRWKGGYVTEGKYKFADGYGTTVWFKGGKVIQEDSGTFEKGLRHGEISHLFPGGRVKKSYWEHGQEVSSPIKQEQRSIENNPHWIMDKESGVYLWNPKPQEGESIRWKGGYVTEGKYKFADGYGTTVWFKGGKVIQEDSGTFEKGLRHGEITHLFPGGRVKKSYWEHGQEVSSP